MKIALKLIIYLKQDKIRGMIHNKYILGGIKMKRYSELIEKLQTMVDEESSFKLATVTHYLQNSDNSASSYYKDEAIEILKEMKCDISLKDFKWDVPFPPVEDNNFTFIDLFAGIGGMRIAFQNLGGRCVFSSEWEKHAKITYQKNEERDIIFERSE